MSAPLETLWKALGELPLVHQVWPAVRQQSALETIARENPNAARRLRERYEFVRGFLVVPIVAIAGLINSGKSSLVCSFLSPAARTRVLRGMSSRHGTQRFTLWIPAGWKADPVFFARLEEMLTRVFGQAPELLSEEPEAAHAQQRTHDGLAVPLLASDPALDAHKIALLDCPDIQRPQPGELAGINARLEAVAAAGEICAGVILVAPRTEIEVRELQAIIERMPAATRIYAINLMRREPAHEVLREAREHLRPAPDYCYGAYDFDVDANRQFLPAWDPNREPASERTEQLPCFFELADDPQENAPEAIAPERSLLRVGERLSPEILRQKRQAELRAELKHELHTMLEAIEGNLSRAAAELTEARQEMLASCARLMHGEAGELRIKMDPEIAESMAESIRRTAPIDMRAFLLLKHRLFTGISKLKEQGQRVVAGLTGKYSLGPAKEKLAVGRLDPGQIESMLALWSAGLGFPRDKGAWSGAATAVLERYLREERTNMPAEEWDSLTQELWASAPRKLARAGMAATLVVALLTAAIIPFDGGTAFAITMKELLACMAIGGAGGGLFGFGGSALLQQRVEAGIGRQQFANFYAIVCDQVGLPREIPAPHEQEYPAPRVPERRNAEAFGVTDRKWLLAEVHRPSREKLRALLAAM